VDDLNISSTMLHHYRENKPEIAVDRGFWYLWALQRPRLKYRHETFGERNSVEGFFSRFKEILE